MRRNMTSRRAWGGTSRLRLTVMFLVVLLPPAVTLIWLGFQLLEQDRILEAQREIEGRQAAAVEIARSLGQSLAEAENWTPSGTLPDGVLGVTVSSTGILAHPAGQLLWGQARTPLMEPPTQPFEAVEKLEFQGAAESALRTYAELARSKAPALRAGALLRIARVERNRHRIEQALEAYRSLAEIRGISFDGTPIDLLARRAICELLEESSRKQELSGAGTSIGDVTFLQDIGAWIGLRGFLSRRRLSGGLDGHWRSLPTVRGFRPLHTGFGKCRRTVASRHRVGKAF